MNSTDALLLYYLGFAVPILLLWACFADLYDATTNERTRYRTMAAGFAALGLLHPGFALCGLDMARQLAQGDLALEPRAAATVQLAIVAVGLSACIASVVVVATLAK